MSLRDKVCDIVFEKGYYWFYPVMVLWLGATSLIGYIIPSSLRSMEYVFIEYNHFPNYYNPYVDLSAMLYNFDSVLIGIALGFIIVSFMFDVYRIYKERTS